MHDLLAFGACVVGKSAAQLNFLVQSLKTIFT